MKRTREKVNTDPGSRIEASHKFDLAEENDTESPDAAHREEKLADLRSRILAGSYRVRSSEIAGKLMDVMSEHTADRRPHEDLSIERERG